MLRQYEGGAVTLSRPQGSGVARLQLDHPERRNAMSGAMMVQLLEAVEELEAWEEGVGLLLTGAANPRGVFCSGGGLRTIEVGLKDSEAGFQMATLMGEATRRLRALPLVSVCALEGAAVGGGAELATATDYRVAAAGASLAFVQARMGVAPGWGGGGRLVELVGRRAALDLLLTCRKVGAEEGLALGLVDQVVEGEAVGAAEKWLEEGVGGGRAPEVVRALKAMVTGEGEEARHFAPLWGGEANRKALASHIKHR